MAKEKAMYAKEERDKQGGNDVDDEPIAKYARIHSKNKKVISFTTRGAQNESL